MKRHIERWHGHARGSAPKSNEHFVGNTTSLAFDSNSTPQDVSGTEQLQSASPNSHSQPSVSSNTISQQSLPSNLPNRSSHHYSMRVPGSGNLLACRPYANSVAGFGTTFSYKGFVCEKCGNQLPAVPCNIKVISKLTQVNILKDSNFVDRYRTIGVRRSALVECINFDGPPVIIPKLSLEEYLQFVLCPLYGKSYIRRNML